MNKRIVSKRAAACALASLWAAALSAHAAQTDGSRASKQENIGVATGIAAGALAAGPVGAVLGAAAGAWLGARYHKESEARAILASDLHASEAHGARLAGEMQTMSHSLLESDARRVRLEGALGRTEGLEASIAFRTGASELEPAARQQLAKLGALVAALPDAALRVSGYADPRGPVEFNLALSRSRAEAVKSALVRAGVDEQHIVVEAFGSADGCGSPDDFDEFAFERRADVHLERAAPAAVAERE